MRRLLFGERAAIHAAQQEIEQSLAGSGIIKHVSDQRGLRCLVHEISQPARGRIPGSSGKMHIPRHSALEAGRDADPTPGNIRTRASAAPDRNDGAWHDERWRGSGFFVPRIRDRRGRDGAGSEAGAGAVGKKYATIGRAYLHHVTGEVARRMIQALFGRRDVAARRIIVWTEMQAAAAPLRDFDQPGNPNGSEGIDDGLWSFDHQLDLQ